MKRLIVSLFVFLFVTIVPTFGQVDEYKFNLVPRRISFGQSLTVTSSPIFSNLTLNPTLGAELITFDGTYGAGAGWSFATGKWSHTGGGGTTALTSTWVPTAGVKYKIVIIVTDAGTGDVFFTFGSGTFATISASNTYTYYFISSSAGAMTFTPTNTNWTGSVDAVSVKVENNSVLTTGLTTLNPFQLLLGNQGDSIYPAIAPIADSDLGIYFNIYSPTINHTVGGYRKFFINTNGAYIDNGFLSLNSGGNTLLTSDNVGVIQMGLDAATPTDQTLKGPDGNGSDKNGGTSNFASGCSTGLGPEGVINLSTSGTGITSGSSLNSLVTRGTVSEWGIAVTARSFNVFMVADAIMQPFSVVMSDAGTDNRFDINVAGGTLPIGVFINAGPSAVATEYRIAVQGRCYVLPDEDIAITRGHVIFVDAGSAGRVDDNAALQAAGLNVGRALYSEPVTYTINPATGVNTTTETITMDAAPGWAVNDPVVYYNSGGTSIGGLTDGNVYWIKTISGADVTLSATRGGATVDLTSQGDDATQYLQRLPICILHWQ